MKIYFDGDSWTFGSEVELHERFSYLLSNHYGVEECNVSVGGASNHRVARQTLVEYNISDYDLAIVQLTLPARSEWCVDDKWYQVRPMTRGWKGNTLKNYVCDYYEKIYSEKYGNTYEKLFATSIRSHCKVNNVPLILMTNRTAYPIKYPTTYCNAEFDVHLADLDLPRAKNKHPSSEGHRMIFEILKDIIDEKNLLDIT
tara:strand:+ start:431 stop:1030 length:600 start_codon:yes stop_codon:yes gene_type:complete